MGYAVSDNPTALTHQFEALVTTPIYDDVDLSVMLYEVSPNYQRIFRFNAFQPLVPASVLKVLVSTVAMNSLGVDRRFETLVLTDGQHHEGVLYGNLYIQGKGAPDVTLNEIEHAVMVLDKLGVKQIKGDLVYDTSLFEAYPPKSLHRARFYNAPSSALTFNSNAVEFVLSGDVVPILVPSPNTSYVRYTYRGLTIDLDRDHAGGPAISWTPYQFGDDYELSGVVGQPDLDNHYLRVLVSRPGLYMATVFKDHCRRRQIVFDGSVRSGKVPETATPLTSIQSLPLSHYIRRLNQESNNVIAENMTQFLGAFTFDTTGRLDLGVQVLREFCERNLSIKPIHFILDDATGLSLENKFKASDLMKILLYNHRRPTYYQTLVQSLVHQGVTLGFERPSPPQGFNVYLKTGTLALSGVNTMMGYIESQTTNRRYTFVILANRRKPGKPVYKGTYTYPILEWLYTLVD